MADFFILGHVVEKVRQRSQIRLPPQPLSMANVLKSSYIIYLNSGNNCAVADFFILGHVTQKSG